jgi:hypothetical protein
VDKSVAASAYQSSIANNRIIITTNRSLTRSLHTTSSKVIPKAKVHDENLNPSENIYLCCADYFRSLLQHFYLVRRNANFPIHEKEMYKDIETKILFTLFEVLDKHVRVDCNDRI